MKDEQLETVGEACIKVKPDMSAVKELLLALVETIDEYEQKQVD